MTEAFNDFETTTMIPEPSSTRAAVLTLYDIFIPLLGIFIILLNSLVVISSGLLLRKRKEPRSTYLFLGNVGLADLLTGIAVLFGHFYPRERRCELSCAIQIGMIVSSTIVSVLSVLLVAIDRFLYILYGLKYQRYVYPNRARVLIVATWIIGFITGFLPAMAPSLRGTMSARQCWFILLDPGLILATTLIGILPILIVFILYSIILYIALRKISELKRATSGENGTETANNLRYFRGSAPNLNQMREVSDSTVPLREQPSNSSKWWHCCCWKSETGDIQQTETPSSKEPSKWKAIKIVMFTTGAFFVTWVPYFIASTMFIYCDQESNPRYCNGLKIAIASPLAILGFANSLINPVIYAWWHTGFRTNSIRIWSQRLRDTKCCRCCFNKSDEGSSWYYRATSSLSPGTANLSSTTNLSTSSIQNVTATNCIPTQKPRQLGICKANLFNDANRNPSANSATAATSDLER